ncbi:hypothetical protein [Pseudoflavonifractor phocaeensis]|uniref:hypothetical protein n=1 Tax=Pseudoflavonifractor phocaeensis TaxID=1870988 RepID=UPI00195A40DC|nr:hypothetical protein [Pseudoflavonifractor phocaeensis]MBM6927602.1 hypothetical protein [Pseudoflavonifractor phocaeensis]
MGSILNGCEHFFSNVNERKSKPHDMMVQLLLKWNGYQLELQVGELADMFISIAAGAAGEKALLEWIEQHLIR